MCVYPELSNYISDCIGSVKPILEKGEIEKLIIALLSKDRVVEKFVFDIKQEPVRPFDVKDDKDLSKLEESLRAFCLKLSISDSLLKPLPSDTTFSIQIQVPEDYKQDVDMPEKKEVEMGKSHIVPLKSLKTEICEMQLYVEESNQKNKTPSHPS
ncbi:Mitotic spindle assembly checkpoint protein MAD2B [Armadillidium vulgare]|nr:Mitotic spindle assembly checkpoint protein MAD2B [Armadillidium vulgare]